MRVAGVVEGDDARAGAIGPSLVFAEAGVGGSGPFIAFNDRADGGAYSGWLTGPNAKGGGDDEGGGIVTAWIGGRRT